MRITYLSNSGFCVEVGDDYLVFDCHNPRGQPALACETLRQYRTVTVFISHSHGDHYARDIWKTENARFAAAFDIDVPSPYKGVCTSFRPGDATEINGLSVRAFGSTDEGVSFYVERGDVALFHAGDLNDWHWRDEGGETFAREAEDAFLRELTKIKAAKLKPIDMAFFPVDPRIGSDYYRGALLFAKAMRPKRFMPMHFGKTYAPPKTFIADMAPYTKLLTPPAMGETIETARP
ncbi:MAG: MBL fold metallo-hydrolase [Clostridiales bacterium]|jgi:L-ascorbate metabolism protein UlaG (beta-lactamase superfamily)|nr:MBL fold metallo-hydrolase [Clostridiales bacterium]